MALTKAQAQAARDLAVQAVKDAQCAVGKAVGQDKERAKVALQVRLEELAVAKEALKKINVASSGLAPIEEHPRDLPPQPLMN